MLGRISLSVAVFFAIAAAPVSAGPGVSFVITTKASNNGSAGSTSSTKVQAMNGVLRFDAVDAAEGSGKDSYVLVNPSTKILSVVMPANKQYLEMNFGDSVGQAMAASAQIMASTTLLSDIKVSGANLGGGGMINGYSTNHYRINTSFAESDQAGKAVRKHSSVEEFWVTDQLKDIPDPLEAFTRAFGGKNGMPAIGGTVGELMRQRGEAQRKLFTGLPIRSVVKSTTVDPDGSKTEETSTTDITDLKQVSLDPAVFQVPAGYTRLDLGSMLAGAQSQLRDAFKNVGGDVSGSLVGAAKEGAQQAVEETKQEAADATKNAVKDKAKCALGGFLGKKKC